MLYLMLTDINENSPWFLLMFNCFCIFTRKINHDFLFKGTHHFDDWARTLIFYVKPFSKLNQSCLLYFAVESLSRWRCVHGGLYGVFLWQAGWQTDRHADILFVLSSFCTCQYPSHLSPQPTALVSVFIASVCIHVILSGCPRMRTYVSHAFIRLCFRLFHRSPSLLALSLWKMPSHHLSQQQFNNKYIYTTAWMTQSVLQ